MYVDVANIGNQILVRDTKGDYVIDNFKPKLFFPSSKPTDMVPVIGDKYVTPIECDSIKDFKDRIWSYKSRNTKVYGDKNAIVQFMFENYREECFTDYDQLKIFNIDIEVNVDKGFPDPSEAKWPINAITVLFDGNYYVWGNSINGEVFEHNREDVFYSEFSTEVDLMDHFIDFWHEKNPHIVTGWNIDTFDIPYIVNRVTKIIGKSKAEKLSPYGVLKSRLKKDSFQRESETIDILGVARLDALTLYKKYVLSPRENYKLDTIAEVELDEKKLNYEEYGSLRNLYRENYQQFIEYNIKDVDLVDRIDKAQGLIRQAVSLANYAKVNYQDVFSPIKMWESIIHHHLMDKNIVPEIKFQFQKKEESFKGAFVIPPIPNLYKWVIGEDLDSLYPSIIRQWNMGPETLVDPFELPEEIQKFYCNIDEEKLRKREYDLEVFKKYNITLCPSGFMFKTDKQSFLSELMEDLFSKRIKEKKLMKIAKAEGRKKDEILHNTFQHSMKILLNSLYGALGSDRCQYFDLRLAESITKSGQMALLSTRDYLNKRLSKHNGNKDLIIAGDTDSVYISIENIVEKECKGKTKEEKLEFSHQFCDRVIQKMIDENFLNIYNYLNCFSNNLNMTREVIADRAIWCKKKRYAMSILDDEGYRPKNPKIKIMGLEIIKSSTPKYCSIKLKEIVGDILLGKDEQEIVENIAAFKVKFMDKHISEIAENKSVNYIRKYMSNDPSIRYIKGAQSHIRAAINFNHVINENDIDLEEIYEGDKIKLVPLKVPNPLDDNMIGFKDLLPESYFKYIDYEIVFEKTFMIPLRKVTDVIGWSLVAKSESAGLF